MFVLTFIEITNSHKMTMMMIYLRVIIMQFFNKASVVVFYSALGDRLCLLAAIDELCPDSGRNVLLSGNRNCDNESKVSDCIADCRTSITKYNKLFKLFGFVGFQ